MSQCKARVVKAMAVDPEGVATLLPRYLAPTPLPPPLAQAAVQVRKELCCGSAANNRCVAGTQQQAYVARITICETSKS